MVTYTGFYLLLFVIAISSAIGFLLVIKLLLRNPRDRLNQLSSLIFLSIVIGSIFFFLSYPTEDPTYFLNTLYYSLAHYFWILGIGFYIGYVSILFKPKLMSKTLNQIILIGIFASILYIIYFVINGIIPQTRPDGTIEGFYWSFPIMFSNTLYLTVLLFLTLYMLIQVNKDISNPILARKIKAFSIAGIIYFILFIAVGIVNYIYDPLLKLIYRIAEVSLVPAAIYTYFAIGKGIPEEQKNE